MRLILNRTTQLATSVFCLTFLALTAFAPRWQPGVRANGCLTPPAGIVSWWPGNGDANDVVGANNGTFVGEAAPGNYDVGKVGAAFELDGVNDYVDVGPGFNLNTMTLEAWVKVDDATNTGDRRVISKDNYLLPGARKLFALKSSSFDNSGNQGRPSFSVYIDGVGFDFVEGPTQLTDGWHHLVGVRDVAANRFELWVNGSLVASKAPPLVAGAIDSGVNAVLGRVSPSSAIEHFAGLLDEATVYNTALSPASIMAIYAAGGDGKCLSSADVKVTKTADTSHPDVNTDVTYTITVKNQSATTAANNVVVADSLPSPQLSFVSCASTLGGVCGGSGNNRTVTFASLAPGATATITLKAKVAACLADGTMITNTASATSSTPDSDPTNNSSDVTVKACDTSYIYPYSLGHYVIGLASGGGTGTVQVFTPGGCAWTATAMTISGAPGWLTITSPASGMGTGNGTINYSFTANPGPGAREAKITVTFASGAVWKVVFSQGTAGVAYAAGGRVFNLARTGGVPGVVMTFTKAGGPSSCNIPAPTLTDANGFWNQSGFTPGCVYEVRHNKPGFRFRLAFQQFSRASTNINFYQF
jgi:uncharacterized repeat protein (TIGR01451 family)